ncbi:HAD family hydrolase [Mycobacteroides stephanolepidis]|uniref:HAD family hydrolase n=1 Tax=[Mycobacterium] stephanolepidis TaxID=1520670 RepID=UPI0013002D0C|nr:HAD family hydrolase [[Mycobacterium] stephanolepidis]
MPQGQTPLRERENVTTVLWDLDGTLVGIKQRRFRALMPLVAAWSFRDLMPPSRFLRKLRDALPQVRANASSDTNYHMMIQILADSAGVDFADADMRMRHLADVEFPRLRRLFYPVPEAQGAVSQLAGQGIRQVVATNPLWPESTVTARLSWGGLDPAVFQHITSGETMRRSKPRVDFYRELLDVLGLPADECVLIGNDAVQDSPAADLGIPVFILGITGGWAELPSWLGLREAPCSS